MKLTPSILTAREARGSSDARGSREASLSRASSDSSFPRNRATLVVASEKGSVTPSAEMQRERTAFLERYNPQVCRHMALDADRCFCGCAPALEVVRRRYGTQTAVAWVTIQLSETA